jgi:hypothetical protein
VQISELSPQPLSDRRYLPLARAVSRSEPRHDANRLMPLGGWEGRNPAQCRSIVEASATALHRASQYPSRMPSGVLTCTSGVKVQ